MNSDSLLSFGPNAGYLVELYQLYLSDPSMLASEWQDFFARLEQEQHPVNGQSVPGDGGGQPSADARKAVVSNGELAGQAGGDAVAEKLISSFERYGHLAAHVSPVQRGGLQAEDPRELTLAFAGETRDPASVKLQQTTFAGRSIGTLKELVDALKVTYCGSVGFEFYHLTREEEREWLRVRIERRYAEPSARSADEQRGILSDLIRGELFESELHRKYVGTKRFSLEGNETLIPVLSSVVRHCATTGVQAAVFGMAHRGRLNVLANTIGKPLPQLFAEFEDKTLAAFVGAGDVKYHLGYQSKVTLPDGEVELQMVPNPSHLEFVNPVVEGIARAAQDYTHAGNRRAVLPVAMHGDAAVAGQGIVFETVNYSRIDGYATGGTLHIVINNQIGFTTTPDESRSTRYCTDLAKGIDAPVFHVNCDDPEAACWVARLALDYRNTFAKDVFIDLIGHRKHGHNEGDDPSFTQPLMYGEIKERKPTWVTYAQGLKELAVIDEAFLQGEVERYKSYFSAEQEKVTPGAQGEATALHGRLISNVARTAVKESVLQEIGAALAAWPQGFSPHPKLAKIIEKRAETVQSGEAIEWGVAEALAFGSLALDGVPVRLSGQDCCRGTFSQRHLVLDDYTRAQSFSPLAVLLESKGAHAHFEVFNSPLSEAAVVGFEFGYAAAAPHTLTIWEGQFGDFGNGAQVLIDQFISSSESKWGQISGVVLMLPHAYEGQGPEHSSARLERYLQMCAEGNMQVCYPTTAAQHFHLLRRQGLSSLKRPLVIMTPKSLLRLPAAASPLSEMSQGSFKRVLTTPLSKKKSCEALVLLSGKVFHDVAAALKDAGELSARLVRVEELYPLPVDEIAALVKESCASRFFWLQEEPENMGAWSYMRGQLRDSLGIDLTYIGRPASAATATGSAKSHAREQKAIMGALLTLIKGC
jgi:2-oxoglutarate dehydrogenase E1 component